MPAFFKKPRISLPAALLFTHRPPVCSFVAPCIRLKYGPPNAHIILSRALTALLVLARAAGAAEVSREYYCEDIKKPFFSVARAPDGTAKVRPARTRSISFEFSMPKRKKTARVFIVGESAATLLIFGEEFLRRFLNKSFPGKNVEIINCGMPAYESRRILSVFEEALAYEPDLLIALSGNNETGRDFCPDFNAELRRRVRKIKIRLASLSMAPEDAAAAVSLAIHEERLRAMAGLAGKKGTSVLFCTLPANLRDFAPSGYPPENIGAGIRLVSERNFKAALEFFRLNGKNSREPFSLFYSGRALEGLGRTAEAAESYAAAVKYDPASDRCSGERNAMIRRVAAAEGACLADLETAFLGIASGAITGGDEIGDGVHWFKKYAPFVSAVIGRAAKTCPSIKGKGQIPAPELLKPRRGALKEDFSIVLSYVCAFARDQISRPGGSAGAVSEQAVVTLERLCRMNCGKLERLLFDAEALNDESIKEIRENEWTPVGLIADPPLRKTETAWRPFLLRNAAEMFRRAGRYGPAARAAAAIPGPAARGGLEAPAGKKAAPIHRPLRESEAAAKRLSDLAVEKMLEGDFAGARPLLAQAAQKDGDGLEIRLNACFLAARTKDVAFGEEHCGKAVFLSAHPPRHAAPVQDGVALALYSRASFRLETGNKGACSDLRSAHEKASPARKLGAETRALAAKRCPL